ncbi:hypothetical protein BDF19DRAFT_434324 [Syncephalis fuscata]|nr:hypothetical protein BDF19DRAFT_434324 [Syncephalis fuscata]
MNESALKKLKVNELKEMLANQGLSNAGKKEELIARLLEAGAAASTGLEDELSHLAPPPQDDDDGFSWDAPNEGESGNATAEKPAPVASSAIRAAAQPAAASVPVSKPAVTEKATPAPASVSAPAPAPTASTSNNTGADNDEIERIKKRAMRFGVPVSEETKQADRMKRFGASIAEQPAGKTNTSDASKKRTPDMATYVPPGARADVAGKRQDKANQSISSSLNVDEDAIKRRQARFGIVDDSNNKSDQKQPAAKKEASQPVDSEEAERRQRRAERFGVAEGDSAAKKLKTS